MGWIKQLWQSITQFLGGAAPPKGALPEADVSLILDLQKTTPPMDINPPYLTHFKKENKNLCYVATHHDAGEESATFKTIREAMDTFKPDFVIVEGLRTELGRSPAPVIAQSQKDAEQHFAHAYEASYTSHLAHQKDIPFIGGEPPNEAIFSKMQTHGYTHVDMMAGHLLRMIPVWRKQGILDETNFEKQATQYLENESFCHQFPPEKRLSFAQFEQWYKQHGAPGKPYLQLEQQDFAPMNRPDSTYLERQNYWISAVRDKHLVETIGNALSSNDRVLVVYGSGHLDKSRPVFQKMFGTEGTTIELHSDNPEEPASNWADKTSKEPTPELSVRRA